MKICFHKAEHGDSIHIRFLDASETSRNILIDGGPFATYESASPRAAGDLKRCVARIREKGEAFDLLVLSHVDQDHVGGLIKWFERDADAFSLIKEIWFNSGRLISEYFKEPVKADRVLTFLPPSGSTDTSIDDGVAFEDHIEKKGIWKRQIFKQGLEPVELHGVTLTLLSPDDLGLKALEKTWSIEAPASMTSGRGDDYRMSLADHIARDKFKNDGSVPNQSSIAFVLTWKNKNFLYLADAHPKPVISALRELGYTSDNKLKAELVKLAHHGSAGNTNEGLLDLIDCRSFVISSNGAIFDLPDKQCLARIIHKVPDCRLYFNYPHKIEEIFTSEDYSSFPYFKALPVPDIFEF